MKQALVSISCITYNHQDFIEECLNGFFIQQCNFDVELVISDDKSTDGTVKVIERCLQRKPDNFTIRFTAHETNMGAAPNFVWCMEQCAGKYIALCEGDDYWTDPLKLQKQVDFLEENEEYSIVGHNRYILKEGRLTESISKTWVFTQCMLFRKECLSKNFFKYSQDVFNGDSFLYYYLCMKGKPKVLDFFGAVYRITSLGVYSSIKDDSEKLIKALNTNKQLYYLSNKTSYKYSKEVNKEVKIQLKYTLFSLVKTFIKKRDCFKVIRFSFLLVRYVEIKDIKKKLKLYVK